ncbi:MAG TPA: prolyl oligopeptidase family serine peptidase [Streptosporangiaceae bacterium]|nr:prolyl oligopeptidase family serine peptidase [Streptosporangiaceae bacterium]
MQAPRAQRIPSVRDLHGQRDVDDYAWMRDHDSAAFRAYLAAERAYYDAQTAALAELTDALFREAVARTPAVTEDSASWMLRGYRYWYRTPAGAENRQLLRAPLGQAGPGGAEPTLLLDENVLAQATGYVDVQVTEPSPDDRLLAWSVDTSGEEIYQLRFTEIDTGRELPDVIERTYPGGAWSSDCAHFFYLVPDEAYRPYQVWRHAIGTPVAGDELVYEEGDERFALTLAASRSGELVIITAESRDTTDVRLIPASDPLVAPILVEPRRRGVEYRVDHAADPTGGRGDLLIVTDDGAPEFTLMRAPVEAPGRANWTAVSCPAVAPVRDDTRLVSCDVVAGHLLLTLRRDGAPMLAITDRGGGDVREIHPALAAGAIAVRHAADYRAGTVIIAEESLIEPPRWSELDLATGGRREVKRAEVPGFDAALYRTKRIDARAGDGASVPVTLAYRVDTPLDGTAALLLYGYGAYEACLDAEFDRGLPSLLDRGVVYAVAHVRGGGERGRYWWQQGRLRAKPRTFSDFIEVADWLAGDAPGATPLVDGHRIASRGLSAGGLLQGAVYSRAPGRWRAVVAEVPFVDCVTTMLDPSIPLTINEWDEWGDPRDAEDFACLRSYSPYDNPPAGARPDLLVTGAVHDPRVLVHEPAKWVARLRLTDTAGSRVLLRVELGAGAHTGPSGRFGHLRYEAEVQAFILAALGLAGGPAS